MHIQYYLQNAKNNNNSGQHFLPDVDLSSASPYAAMYLEIMTDFTLENTTL